MSNVSSTSGGSDSCLFYIILYKYFCFKDHINKVQDYKFYPLDVSSSLNKLFFGELPFLSLMGVNVMMMTRFQNVAVENNTVHVLFDNQISLYHEQLLLPVE